MGAGMSKMYTVNIRCIGCPHLYARFDQSKDINLVIELLQDVDQKR